MKLLQYNRLGSELVNITAWLSLAFCVGWVLFGGLQFVLASLFVTDAIVEQVAFVGMQQGLIAPGHLWLLSHLPLVYGWVFLMGVIITFASFDLLRRRQWARRFFVGMMVITALANTSSVISAWFYPQWLVPPRLLQTQALAQSLPLLVMLVVALNGALLWTAYQFCTPPIRAEFDQPQSLDSR